jgi:hypothetical protein
MSFPSKCGRIVPLKKNLKSELVYTDLQTGVSWPCNGNIGGKRITWGDAVSWVESLKYGGYSDWRLPTIEEFESFAMRGGSLNPNFEWFNTNGFTAVQDFFYWSSSSSYDSETVDTWCVGMLDGYVYDWDKTDNCYAWPVRDVKLD